MNRQTVYVNEIPLDTDFLWMQRHAMVSDGYLAQAVIGNLVMCDGLAATPTTGTPDMHVHVGPGWMSQPSTVDSTSWGSLPADSDPVLKMGINTQSTAFLFTAPGSAGYSQIFLIEGQMQEADTGSEVLPYVNAANPGSPWSGPSNDGLPQYTERLQNVALNVVAGTPNTTGSETSPAATSGWTPLWLVTVANAQTSITAANIVQADGAPFIQNKLSQQRTILQANTTFYFSPYGNDANSGRLGTPSSAWQTITGAWKNICTNYDLNGFNVVVQAVGGTGTTFAGGALVGAPLGLTIGNSITFQGNSSSPSNFIIYGNPGTCFYAGAGTNVQINGFTIESNGSGLNGYGFWADQGGVISAANILCAGCSQAAVRTSAGGKVGLSAFGVSAGGVDFVNASDSGSSVIVETSSAGSAVAGTFTDAFANASSNASVKFYNSTQSGAPVFTGSTTGNQFNVSMNGTVLNGSALPGSGTVIATGGQHT